MSRCQGLYAYGQSRNEHTQCICQQDGIGNELNFDYFLIIYLLLIMCKLLLIYYIITIIFSG